MTIPYRRATPRTDTLWVAQCFIAEELTQPWEQLTDEQQYEFETHGSVACDGSFAPGPWCTDCRFGGFEEDTL